MTTYAIGSVNGNHTLLTKLLEIIAFDPDQDCLWFSGNLTGNNPESLSVLRLVKDLGNKAVTVMGPKELQLLTFVEGLTAQENPAFNSILEAHDRDELIKWLRKRPFLHHDSKLKFTLVHGGIPAEWTFSQTVTFAYEVESTLSNSNYLAFLENQGQDQTRWHAKLTGWKRLRFIANAFTLMKYCNEQGRLDFKTCGPVASNPELTPWYRMPNRSTGNLNIVFADSGDFQDETFPGIYGLSASAGLCALNLDQTAEKFFAEA